MTSKIHQPPFRLVDVLKKNRPEVLKRHAEQLAVLQTALPPEVMQTRFRHNSVLISPKSLHLLVQPDVLRRWGVFAVYKPPFCPMKRANAHPNYHRVSLESFVSAALSSRDIAPYVRDTLHSRLKVRVLYSLATEYSGPVMISLKDDIPLAHSMHHTHMSYQILIAGHPPIDTASPTSPEEEAFLLSTLYPDVSLQSSSSVPGNQTPCGTASSFSSTASPSPSVSYRVARNGYYAHHPVSLVELEIGAPPTPTPPCLSAFVAAVFHSFIIGDPSGLLSHEKDGGKSEAPQKRTSTKISSCMTCASRENNRFGLHGDCDFPRVFAHLHQVRCSTGLLSSSSLCSTESFFSENEAKKASTSSDEELHKMHFQCANCFEPILQSNPMYGLKGISMNIRDGSWSPISEALS